MKILKLSKSQRIFGSIEAANRGKKWSNIKFLFLKVVVAGAVCILPLLAYHYIANGTYEYPAVVVPVLIIIVLFPISGLIGVLLEYYVKISNRQRQVLEEQEKMINELERKVYSSISEKCWGNGA